MRVVHVGAHSSPHTVDGINSVIWTIAVEQQRLGHQVALLLIQAPDTAAQELAASSGIKLIRANASAWRYEPAVVRALTRERRPDIVHFHSVFVPRQATLARALRRAGIPYVITPHGGLMPQVLSRSRLKKQIYGALVEKPRFRHAAGIAYVTPGGEQTIRDYAPGFAGALEWVSNPVAVDELQAQRWSPAPGRPRLLFLGRFDVYHKGIDRLAAIAARLPDADFALYGADDPGTIRQLDRIRAHRPPNLSFNEPVYGPEKIELLSVAAMYVQVSRWEALSISILEALAMGVPCAISETMSMAEMFREHDLGLVLSAQPARAARQIADALHDRRQLETWSARSRAFSRETFAPDAVARRVLAVYDAALAFGRASLFTKLDGQSWIAPAEFADDHD
jgi:glycosyltransferase involved in cell wall biosynthesis